MQNSDCPACSQPTPLFHLVCGSGGSRAILASAGAILACQQAGIAWETIGGNSGGATPTVLLAAGFSASAVVKFAIETDFGSLLTRHGSIGQILVAHQLRRIYETTRPARGVLSSEGLGEFFDTLIPTWPERFWTVAVDGNDSLIFTLAGAYLTRSEDDMERLSSQPAPLGLVIRATCAVPGVIDAVKCQAGERHFVLVDGGLGYEGRCPVSIPVRLFGAQRQRIIVCDVGEEKRVRSKVGERLWKLLCGGRCFPASREHDIDDKEIIVIRPGITSVRSLQFRPSRDDKWRTVMSGYQGAVVALADAGILSGDALSSASQISENFTLLEAECQGKDRGLLSCKTECLLGANGLY